MAIRPADLHLQHPIPMDHNLQHPASVPRTITSPTFAQARLLELIQTFVHPLLLRIAVLHPLAFLRVGPDLKATINLVQV